MTSGGASPSAASLNPGGQTLEEGRVLRATGGYKAHLLVPGTDNYHGAHAGHNAWTI